MNKNSVLMGTLISAAEIAAVVTILALCSSPTSSDDVIKRSELRSVKHNDTVSLSEAQIETISKHSGLNKEEISDYLEEKGLTLEEKMPETIEVIPEAETLSIDDIEVSYAEEPAEIEIEEEYSVFDDPEIPHYSDEDILGGSIFTPTMYEEPKTMYTQTSMNFRAKPSVDSDKVGTCERGAEITIVGEYDGWYLLDDGSYINGSDEYVGAEKPAEIVPSSATVSDVSIPSFIEGGSDDVRSAVAGVWYMFPENIRTSLINNGLQIGIGDWYMTTYHDAPSGTCGAYNWYSKHLAVRDNKTRALNAIAHELGHAIDDLYGGVSYSDEFMNCFNTESAGLISYFGGNGKAYHDSYVESDCREFFAEVVSNIIYSGDTYEYSAPNSYAFVKSYLGF